MKSLEWFLLSGEKVVRSWMLSFVSLKRSVIYAMLFLLSGSGGDGLLLIDDNILSIADEILDVIRARKGEIVEDKTTADDEAEKAKSDVDNDQTDAERGKEESGEQDKTEETPTEQNGEKAKTEGKETVTVFDNFISVK